ncbi:hypothetical protein BpHYR1_049507 [Brachionus plicatilis]|uniref:Uncharacterized protein n=1 Tax=Brachionus plicatilis TaxID=10195 RepID=A0A3M7SW10_BRAPC|nr:hypothetical protein BpHYR1_049507 [Brachionus plicatilis]
MRILMILIFMKKRIYLNYLFGNKHCC